MIPAIPEPFCLKPRIIYFRKVLSASIRVSEIQKFFLDFLVKVVR
jgi:hypothetical protein